MPNFGKASKEKLETCDTRLQQLFNRVIENFDCTVITGHRDKASQDKAFASGNSKKQWPNSKHNSKPSKAVDVAPVEYKNGKSVINWNDVHRICYFAGHVMAIAKDMGIGVRWGGDWDSDTELSDNSFDDLVHFELI